MRDAQVHGHISRTDVSDSSMLTWTRIEGCQECSTVRYLQQVNGGCHCGLPLLAATQPELQRTCAVLVHRSKSCPVVRPLACECSLQA
jgi:hypothetical protein